MIYPPAAVQFVVHSLAGVSPIFVSGGGDGQTKTLHSSYPRSLSSNRVITLFAACTVLILLYSNYSLRLQGNELGGERNIRTLSTPAVVPKTQAFRCPKETNTSASEFYGQSGEDKYLIENFFKNVCGGSYIEMGALDGQTYSNSLYFNKAMSWKGLLIEANPINYAKLIENRQNELVTPINAAVCDKEQDVHWISQHAVGGIVEFAPEEFKKKWWKQANIDNADVIKCLPLNQIVRDANITTHGHAFFDFYSLDVEGAEYDVLKAVNFDTLAFGVIFYECDDHNALKNQVVRTFLESKGYRFVVHHQRSNWHININFFNIYRDIVHDN